jgi:Arc/MetJ family transcription regulator
LTRKRTGPILIWEYSLIDMGGLMKTTIEISDALLSAAKRRAGERGTTLRALVEEGLRNLLAEAPPGGAFTLRDASVDGHGLQPGVREGSWERIADLTYEGRGG